MSIFEFFKPNPNRGKKQSEKDLEPGIIVSLGKTTVCPPGTMVSPIHSVNTDSGFNSYLPSTECSVCHKVRNIPASYFGPLYPCPDCQKIEDIKRTQVETSRMLEDLNKSVKQLLNKADVPEPKQQYPILSGTISSRTIYSGQIGWCTFTSGSFCSGFMPASKWQNYGYCCS